MPPADSQSFIIVTFRLPGFHCYPGAPAPVEFLRARHRHLFCFVLRFAVTHDEREKEFFIISREVQAVLAARYGTPAEFGTASCEQLARQLFDAYAEQGCYSVEVWEDDENGALVTR
jgi:hypothetical protein